MNIKKFVEAKTESGMGGGAPTTLDDANAGQQQATKHGPKGGRQQQLLQRYDHSIFLAPNLIIRCNGFRPLL
ncbi:hypothetical protein B8W99_10600 [Peribacillus simplex]|nr:hypothetical protein B8W99_10600 [Peribacillus simplex]